MEVEIVILKRECQEYKINISGGCSEHSNNVVVLSLFPDLEKCSKWYDSKIPNF